MKPKLITLNKGREVVLLSNQAYEEQNMTQYLTQLPCDRCYMLVYRESGRHFGKCTGCGAFNFKFYRLTQTQQAVVTDDSTIVLNYGAMNNGKTDAFIYKAILLHFLKYPNSAIGFVCHSLESIQHTVLDTIRQFLPEDLIKRKNGRLMWSNKLIVGKNGSTITFFPTDNESKIRSFNASLMVIPEATQIRESIAMQAASRLRREVVEDAPQINAYGVMSASSNELKKTRNVGQVLIDGNPMIGSWINRVYLPYVGKIFITKDSDIDDFRMILTEEEDMQSGISLHNYPSISNPYAKKDGQKFMNIQKTSYLTKSSLQYQQNVLGKIISSEGLVYPEYKKALINPFPIDLTRMKFYVGLDLGLSNACATIIVAEDQKTGMLYAFRGYKERGLTIPENSKKIMELEYGLDPSKIIVRNCDSQGKAKTHGNDKLSNFQNYAINGISLIGATKERQTSIDQLNDLIKSGRLKIFNNLAFLISEFPNFSYYIQDSTRKKLIRREDCDALDALRYAVEHVYTVNKIAEDAAEEERKSAFDPFRSHETIKMTKIAQNNVW